MSYIFVSYSHEDRELAQQIITQMEASGLDIWVDYQSIPPGADWEMQIAQGLKGCAALVLLQSPRSEISPRVKKEWLYAEHLKKPIYPLLCEGELWFSFVDVQYTDLRSGIEAPLARLISSLPRSAPADTIHTQTAASVGHLEEKFKHNALLNETAFSGSGNLIGVAGGNGLIGVWAINGNRQNAHSEEWFPTKFGYETKALVFSHDEQLLAVATRNQPEAAGIKIFDLDNWRELQVLRDSSDIAHLCFTRDDDYLIAVESGLTPRILVYAADEYRKKRFQLECVIQSEHTGKIRALAISPDNDVFVTGGRVANGIGIRLWSLADGQSYEEVRLDNDPVAVTGVTFSADGKFLYTATLTGTILQWDRGTGAPVDPPLEVGKLVSSIAINTRGDLLAIGHDLPEHYANKRTTAPEVERAAEIQLWNIKNRTLIKTLAKHTNTVTSLAFTPDDKKLASTGLDKCLHMWGVNTDQDSGRKRNPV